MSVKLFSSPWTLYSALDMRRGAESDATIDLTVRVLPGSTPVCAGMPVKDFFHQTFVIQKLIFIFSVGIWK